MCKPFHTHPVMSLRSLFPFPGKETRPFPSGQPPPSPAPDQGHSVQGAPQCPGASAPGGPVSPDEPLSVSKSKDTLAGTVFIGLSVFTTRTLHCLWGVCFQKRRKYLLSPCSQEQNTVERRDDAVVSPMRACVTGLLPPWGDPCSFFKGFKFSLISGMVSPCL